MRDAIRFDTKLSLLSRRFVRNRDGNVTLAFGLALLPMLAASGAAIDYSRASNARQQLHNAVDSTVLALAKRAPVLTDAQLKTEAEAHFKAALAARPDLAALPINVRRTDKRLAIDAAAHVPTRFMGMFGHPSVAVASLSEAVIGQRKAEIALALDNTGSMGRLNKIEELKKATKNFIDAAERAAPAGSGMIRIALVPFDTHVKLDPTYANSNALWLVGKGDPAAADASFDDIRDKTAKRWGMVARKDWKGCITDRSPGYEANGKAPTVAIRASLHPAVSCYDADSLAFAQPLTDNWSALRSSAASMKPSGNTNVTIGARFGFAALAPAGTDALASGVAFGTPDVDKYLILLTDGDNTQNRYTSNGNAIDAKTKGMCDDIKSRSSRTDAAGKPIPDVRIFTVRVIEGDRALLQNCATNASMYKEVSDAGQIDAVFKDILREITRLQLTM
jgi:hypothetical protein